MNRKVCGHKGQNSFLLHLVTETQRTSKGVEHSTSTETRSDRNTPINLPFVGTFYLYHRGTSLPVRADTGGIF